MFVEFLSEQLLNSPSLIVPSITAGFVRLLTVVCHRGSPADNPRSPSSSTLVTKSPGAKVGWNKNIMLLPDLISS